MVKRNLLGMTDKQWVEAGLNRSSQLFKDRYPGMLYWFSDVVVNSTLQSGDKYVKGSGTAVVNFRRMSDEQLLNPKKCSWEIRVLKTKDQYGIPLAVADDLKITEKK